MRAAQLASHISTEAYCSPCRGATLRLDLRDRIQCLMWCDAYERETKLIFQVFISRGSTVVDIGANVGYFSVLAAALAGEAGAVHAFEPDPSCFVTLKENTNSVRQVTVWDLALSDQEGFATLYRTERDSESGWGSILKPSPDHKTQIKVRKTILDQWLVDNVVTNVDFVKIDAEGSEYRILQGSEHVLANHGPALLFEANEECLARDGREVSDLLSLMTSFGYFVWRVESPQRRATGVLLALPEHRSAEAGRLARGVRLARLA
jgi:FkbM family methyltransferase